MVGSFSEPEVGPVQLKTHELTFRDVHDHTTESPSAIVTGPSESFTLRSTAIGNPKHENDCFVGVLQPFALYACTHQP